MWLYIIERIHFYCASNLILIAL